MKLSLRGSRNDSAIKLDLNSGPIFGGGNDLYISNNASSNTESSIKSHTYHPPSDCSPACNDVFAGTSSFSVSDIEVFYEITERTMPYHFLYSDN